MRLSNIEFKAMNNPLRRFIQKHLEFRNFRWMGLTDKNKNILEIGCGSGYGAVLLSALEPTSYIGIDLMPEQIELTGQWHLPRYEFKVMDASDMKDISSNSKGRRVLTSGGKLFVEEPNGNIIRTFDSFFHWGHPDSGFNLMDFEKELVKNGFNIVRGRRVLGFGTYCAQTL